MNPLSSSAAAVEFSSAKRVLIDRDPGLVPEYIFAESPWAAWWIGDEDWNGRDVGVWAFRRVVEVAEKMEFRIHVSADQRFDLFIDGKRVGWGPERGDPACWHYASYDVALAPGRHTFVGQVWWGGKGVLAPYGHMTAELGFILYAEGDAANALLSTGVAEWESRRFTGVEFEPPQARDTFCVTGGRTVIDGAAFPWGIQNGEGEGWKKARKLLSASLRAQGNEVPYQWWLSPSTLPPMFEACLEPGRARWVGAAWDEQTALGAANCLRGEMEADAGADASACAKYAWGRSPVVVAAWTQRHVLFDLENYACAWAAVKCSGGAGATIRVAWAESLFDELSGFDKNDRSAVEGKFFRGLFDSYKLEGGSRMYAPFWWTSGRYVMVSIEAGAEPVVFERLDIRETHYPHKFESAFDCSDARWRDVEPLAKRVLEMCSHESYMDCPYYEQLMYVGDTRLEVLATYATTRDDRLPRKALRTFDLSRRDTGLTASRYPTHEKQIIPTFSLWWIMMAHDYHLWRDDPAFARARLPGVRAILEAIRLNISAADGLLHAPLGWNFVDWPKGWNKGLPPGAETGVNGTINLQASWVFSAAAELEDWAGEPLLAQRDRLASASLAAAAERAFWDESRGLFSEDLARSCFSEHAQCMAILSGHFAGKTPRLLDRLCAPDSGLVPTTIYFSFYLFEAFARANALHRIYDRFALWFGLRGLGFCTTPELPEPTRSDCHAWGAHPMFHTFASISGIRPAAPNFAAIKIAPQPCGSRVISATLPHPRGAVELDLRAEGEGDAVVWHGRIAVPAGVPCEAILPCGNRAAWDGGEMEM